MVMTPCIGLRATGAGIAALLAASIATGAMRAAAAEAWSPARGEVRDAATGAALGGARLTLRSENGASIGRTQSSAGGTFELPITGPGHYRIDAAARGYATAHVEIIVATDADHGAIQVRLVRDAPLREIGRVAPTSASVAQASPTQQIREDALARAGALRATDGLTTLPGITVSGDPLAPGGDAYVSLRGLRPSETQTLLDGHPIGPVGVGASPPDADGTVAGFNFQDAPYFALRDIAVGFGTNAPGASDSLGGTLDLRTLDPTDRPEAGATQGLGNAGRAFTDLFATGTDGKLGYALVHGVEGTYGAFDGSPVAQTGLRGTDLTSTTRDALTYGVSGDYVLRNELAKFVYEPLPATTISLSAYDATSWSDKTGEGDNDYNPYAYVLANAPVGVAAACPHGVLVSTDDGSRCLSPSAFASAASGPAGGGPGAWQALRNQDYAGRLTSSVGEGIVTAQTFADTYDFLYNRDASALSGPLDAFLERWSTQGARVVDDFVARTNDVGFGVSWLRQTLGGDGTTPDGGTIVATTPAAKTDDRIFVRDALSLTRKVGLLLTAAYDKESSDPIPRFDPWLSLVYRLRPSDALRLMGGRSTDEPSLQSDRVDLLPVGALNPNCGAIAHAAPSAPTPVNVGSGPAADLAPEKGTDLELRYDHRFDGGSTFGLTAYDMNVTDRIVSADLAAGAQLPAEELAAALARIQQFCGRSPAPGAVLFTLSRSFNAATARLRGVELGGRLRASAHIALDYSYDIESVVLNDLPASALATDPTLVNGVQVFGVPLHKANLGLNVETRAGLEARLDAHAIGPNNPAQLPAYAYADASLVQPLTRRVALTLAATNVFNSHAQSYGLIGSGLPYATNPVSGVSPVPFSQPFNERYGLAPATVTLSATWRP